MSELVIKAELDRLDEVIAFIDSCLEEHECPMKTQMQIDLSVEELFVNICHYSYTPSNGDARITFGFEPDAHKAVITFDDTGIPFDPVARPDPDVNAPAAERQIGGLGIYMVKKSMLCL